MIGYIYITYINDPSSRLNGCYYIGKRQKEEFDKYYVGSGKIIKDYLKNHSKNNLECEIIDIAETIDELNFLEKEYISSVINKEKCLNIAEGGTGGDTFSGLSEEEKKILREKSSKASKMMWSFRTDEERRKCIMNMVNKRTFWGNKGKKFSDEWKKHQSEGLKKWINDNPEKFKEIQEKSKITKSTKEYKEKFHKSRVEMWKHPEYREKQRLSRERRMLEKEGGKNG